MPLMLSMLGVRVIFGKLLKLLPSMPAITAALNGTPTDLNHLRGVLEAVAEYGAQAESLARSAALNSVGL